MRLFLLLLLSFMLTLVGCNSMSDYIKTRRYQYLYSRDLGSLKMPAGLKTNQTAYTIPPATGVQVTQVPNLYPPTDEY